MTRCSKAKAIRIAYERHIDALRIQYDVLGNAREEGLEKGLAEGLEKGRAEGEQSKQIEIAKNLKSLGVDKATIVKSTGLSEEIINNLQ